MNTAEASGLTLWPETRNRAQRDVIHRKELQTEIVSKSPRVKQGKYVKDINLTSVARLMPAAVMDGW